MPILTIKETLTRSSVSSSTVIAVCGYFQPKEGVTLDNTSYHELKSRADLDAKFASMKGTTRLNGYANLAYLLDRGATIRVCNLPLTGSTVPTSFDGFEDLLKLAVLDGRVGIVVTCGWYSNDETTNAFLSEDLDEDSEILEVCVNNDILFLPDISDKDLLNPANQDAFESSRNIGLYWPALKISGSTTDLISGNFVAAGVMTECDKVGGPWLVPAGVVRGTISGAIGLFLPVPPNPLSVILKPTDYTALKAKKVNTFKVIGDSVVLFGAMTSLTTNSFFEAINVSRMIFDIKKRVSQISLGIAYEFNNNTTWDKWRTQVEDYLGTILAGGGITDYLVVMDETTISQEDILNNIARGRIAIIPTGYIDDDMIYLDIEITDNEVLFSEVSE